MQCDGCNWKPFENDKIQFMTSETQIRLVVCSITEGEEIKNRKKKTKLKRPKGVLTSTNWHLHGKRKSIDFYFFCFLLFSCVFFRCFQLLRNERDPSHGNFRLFFIRSSVYHKVQKFSFCYSPIDGNVFFSLLLNTHFPIIIETINRCTKWFAHRFLFLSGAIQKLPKIERMNC